MKKLCMLISILQSRILDIRIIKFLIIIILNHLFYFICNIASYNITLHIIEKMLNRICRCIISINTQFHFKEHRHIFPIRIIIIAKVIYILKQMISHISRIITFLSRKHKIIKLIIRINV